MYINNNYGNNVFGVDSATGAITLLDEPNMRDQGLRDPRAYASYYRGGILACEREHFLCYESSIVAFSLGQIAARTSGTCKRYTVHKRTWRPVQNIPRLNLLSFSTLYSLIIVSHLFNCTQAGHPHADDGDDTEPGLVRRRKE